MSQYMVLLKGSMKGWEKLGPEESQRIIQKYESWVQKLKSENKFKSGSPLKNGNWVIKNREGVTYADGPFTETKETLTGYFVIEADNNDDAVEIAKGCPALTHGEYVEVFQLGH